MSKKSDDSKQLEDDEYRNETYLEVALRDKNLRAFYNFISAGLLAVVVQNALNDYLYDGGSQYGFKRVLEVLEHFPEFLIFTTSAYIAHLLVFIYWRLRLKLIGRSVFLNLGWIHFLFVYIFLHFLFWNVAGCLSLKYNVSVMWRFIFVLSSIFLYFKGYTFLRTNMRYLHERGEKYVPPTFSHFLYFTFAPTIVYKDVFRRSTLGRSWWKILKNIIEIFINVYLMLLLDSMYIAKELRDFGKEPFSIMDVFYKAFTLLLPTYLLGLISYNLTINLATKLMAELLCFGERKFSTDWWTSTNISAFYIKSNSFVQNFAYEYGFRDFRKYLVFGKSPLAKMLVLVISGLFHELAMFYCFGTTIPPFAIIIVVSFTQAFYPKTGYVFNFLILFQLSLAIGFTACVLRMEYFAKQNCANRPESLFYLPRLFFCEFNK